MPASSDVPQPTGQELPERSLSRWSIISLIFLALAIMFIFLFLWARPSLHLTEGDPAGLVILAYFFNVEAASYIR